MWLIVPIQLNTIAKTTTLQLLSLLNVFNCLCIIELNLVENRGSLSHGSLEIIYSQFQIEFDGI